MGVILSDRDGEVCLGAQEDIHIWIAPSVLDEDLFASRRFDLSMFIAYRLFRNWAGKINLWMCVSEEKKSAAEKYLKTLLYESRFPSATRIIISTDSFNKALHDAPTGDIHLIPVRDHKGVAKIRKISESEEKTFFFIADSGKEDVLA